MIDNTPPLEFKPYLEPLTFTPGDYLLIYYNTQDLLSGIGHYKVRIADLSDPKNLILSAWTRQDSPLRLTTEKRGVFDVQVQAFDKAGNFQEGKIQVRIVHPLLILVSGGIQVRGISFSWWQIYFIIALILLGIGFLIFWSIRPKREGLRIRLYKEIKEAEKEIEDVKRAEEKLRKLRVMEEEARGEWQRLKETLEEETK